METAPRRPTDEELLAHREWVRSLARTLAGDSALADDLEQETLAAALRSPPPRGGLGRAWLGTVLRNLHRRSFRSADRVRRREEAAARPEAGPDPSDVVARAEAHRRVVDAVLALPEPARTAVLLRFFDGLPPREVARRTGVPVETARTRLKRAVEDLRARLGGERGREGLLALLLPLVRPAEGAAGSAGGGAAAVAAGGIAMGTAAKVAVAAGAVALVAGGTLAWRGLSGGVETPPPVPEDRGAPSDPVIPATPPEVPVEDLPPLPAHPAPPAAVKDREVAPAVDLAAGMDIEFGDGTTLAAALDQLGRQVGLGIGYESELLENHCKGTRIPGFRVQGINVLDVMSLLLANAKSPEEGRVLAGEVRGAKLHVLLKAPPPPPKESPEAAKKREDREKALLTRLREEKTSFTFDGQRLPDAFSYLSARHALNIVVDESAREQCEARAMKLTLRDVPLQEALDELLRLDPDLRWEVRDNVVLVLRR